MEKARFRHVLTYNYKEEVYEHSDKPSETIPNEALTVRQLVENFIKGSPLPGYKTPIYEGGGFDDVDVTRVPGFELADYTAEAQRIADRQAETQRQAARSDAEGSEPDGEGRPTERSGGGKPKPDGKDPKAADGGRVANPGDTTNGAGEGGQREPK